MHSVKLYFHFVKMRIQTQIEYRVSFLITIGTYFMLTFIDFTTLWILFQRFGELENWAMWEVGFLYGMISISFGLASMFGRGFDLFDRLIRRGEFDNFLIRPIDTFFHLLVYDFDLRRLGKIGQGFMILLISNSQIEISWRIWKIVFLIVSICGGACFFIGLMVIGATICFWTVQSVEVINIFTHGGNEAGIYPISIYKEWFRNFFTFIIPLAFVNYFPSLVIIGKSDPNGASPIVSYFAPIVGVIFLILSSRIWRFGVKRYQSTGH